MHDKPVHVADVQHDPEYNFGQAPTIGAYRAVLAVPLMRDGAVEGVLLLGRPEPGPFSQRQIDLVQTFADQAVIAIENVRSVRVHETRTEALERQTATADSPEGHRQFAFDLESCSTAVFEVRRRTLPTRLRRRSLEYRGVPFY